MSEILPLYETSTRTTATTASASNSWVLAATVSTSFTGATADAGAAPAESTTWHTETLENRGTCKGKVTANSTHKVASEALGITVMVTTMITASPSFAPVTEV